MLRNNAIMSIAITSCY